ncbi:MAG: hypothetical protein HKN23_12900 [Verrucomicrobiales bacterium]|nr:hypothetical protein [Verrucomicrobiales bacterium]
MAGLKDADDFREGEQFKGGGLLKLALLGGGVLFLIVFFVLYAAGSEQSKQAMGYSWLFAVTYFLTLSIGGIFWTLLHHASNSGWGIVVRRLMENIGSMVLFMLILGLPLIVPAFEFRDALWEWFPKKAEIEHHIHEDFDQKLADLKSDYEKNKADAQSAFNAFKSEKEAAIAKPGVTPGHANHLKEAIAHEEKELQKLLDKDLSEKALTKEIRKDAYMDHHHGDVLLWKKDGYLNNGAWYFRFVLYFIALVGIIYTLRFWSVRNDKDGDPKWFLLQRRWACGFLPFFAAAWTFLVFDWLMALDYKWFSTMWGVYLFAGSALNSMALLILLTSWLRKTGHLKNVVTPEHYHLMGKLLLAFTIFWAYIAFSQFFLIWYANITEETVFYLTRNTGYWNKHAMIFLVAGHFFIPFGFLLIQQAKKNVKYICGVAIWTLLMHLMDIYWIIIPERGPSITHGQEMIIKGAIIYDIVAFLAVGCLFGFALLWRLGTASLFPCRDPRLDESLNVIN